MANEPRRTYFDSFKKYIVNNYRSNLNDRDEELLQVIADDYSVKEIKQAVAYCKSEKTDSLVYLQKALAEKYYQNTKVGIEPKWLNQEFKSEPLDEEDKEWCRKFYKKYCDSEEEYQKRLKDNGLVD